MTSSSSSSSGEGSSYAHLVVYSDSNKAGMNEKYMDKARQEQIIYECSKNSKYFANALEKDAKTDAKIAKMKEKLAGIGESVILQGRDRCLKEEQDLELKRDFSRVCCVLDMDMFFAAVEIRDRPELKDQPVAIGDEGMICTANYVARQYGVRSAMPGFIAKKLW